MIASRRLRKFSHSVAPASLALALAAMFLNTSVASATTYQITELSGVASGTSRLAINNAGAVATQSAGLPVIWHNGVVTTLPLPVGMLYGDASDINDSGVVVGSVHSGSSSSLVMWTSGSTQTLQLLSGDSSGNVAAVNNSGIAVGNSGFWKAVRWSPGVASLGSAPGGGRYPIATGINSSGQIVGAYTAALANSPLFGRGFLWQSGTMIDIGEVQAASSHQNVAINDSGQIVGRNSFGAFVWQSGATTQLPLLDGYTSSTLLSINAYGTAVGYVSGPSIFSGGYVWSQATGSLGANSLGSFTGWDISYFEDINDAGQIVGRGTKDGVGGVAFMITPVPEPSTYAMALAGLACGGWQMFRRRRLQHTRKG